MNNKKHNRKANYQFGNNQKKAFIAAANKFGCFNMKHFGDGYHFMDVEPSLGIISGTKRWDDNKTIYDNLENLSWNCGKMFAIFKHISNGDEKKAHEMAFHFHVENLISFMIHNNTKEGAKALGNYIYQQIHAEPKMMEDFSNGLNDFKDHLRNHTDVFKLQYDNVKEIFEATNAFEDLLNNIFKAA